MSVLCQLPITTIILPRERTLTLADGEAAGEVQVGAHRHRVPLLPPVARALGDPAILLARAGSGKERISSMCTTLAEVRSK